MFRCLSRFSFGPPAKARNSLCRAWDNLPDLVEIDVDDGDEFSVSVSGTSNPGESCFVDLWVNSTRAGRGYRFYFGPSTTLIFGPDIDTFTETGAGRFNLIIAEQNFDSLIGELGWELSREDTHQWGTLASKIRAGWNHEFLDGVGGDAGFGFESSPVGRLVGGNFVPSGTPLTGAFAIEEPGMTTSLWVWESPPRWLRLVCSSPAGSG